MGVVAAVAAVTSTAVAYKEAQDARWDQKQARKEAAVQAEAANIQLEREIAAQEEMARIAAARLEEEKKQYEEEQARVAAEKASFEAEKAALAKKTAQTAAELEAERRKIAEQESARMTAVRRGGRRTLLSEARLVPELGLGSEEVKLGQSPVL